MKNPVIGQYDNRPIVLFPEGWTQGWTDPTIEDGTIPLFIAEAQIAAIAFPKGQRSSYPFTKLPTTRHQWREYRQAYYGGLCPSPFGYQDGKPIAPWGMSMHGVPKLHPADE